MKQYTVSNRPRKVNYVAPEDKGKPKVICYRCGKSGHGAGKCWLKNTECHQ